MATKRRTRQEQPDEDEDDETTEGAGFTETQVAQIHAIAHRAFTGRFKREIGTQVAERVGEQLKPIQDSLQKLLAKRPDDDPAEDDEREDPEPDAPARARGRRRTAEPEDEQPRRRGARREEPPTRREDPETANLKKKVAQMEEERAREKEQARGRERDGMLTEALTKAGVDAHRLKGAVLLLREAMTYDDKEGAWSYRAKRDGFDEDLDVGAGVKEWAATDEGKSYLAPQQGTAARGGAGTRVPQGGSSSTATGGARGTDPKAAKIAKQQQALQSLGENAAALVSGAPLAIG